MDVELPFEIIMKILIERKNIKQDERYKKQYIKVIKELNMRYQTFLNELFEEIYYIYSDENENFFIELIELSLFDDMIIDLDENFSQWFFTPDSDFDDY
tara:strand:- start:72 stop:368 length:297 start_codon:yes stop_codon:yes gene_type:complete